MTHTHDPKTAARESRVTLSVVVPCFNEEATLSKCVDRLLRIEDDSLGLEVLIVNDASSDGSARVADHLATQFPQIRVLTHERNQGKGAALRTGFREATGDFVAVQDADLEYDPKDLKRLVDLLRSGVADVVFGSRFLSSGVHRVLYFWHSLGNKFLTFVSNMLTDLNLSDLETCYKVFRREVIQAIDIKENRFGVEPELVAKVAQMRLRIYEMGVSYYGRTYAEGKKIGVKDGFRALYAILKYNAHRAPVGIQFLIYTFIGAFAAVCNLAVFLAIYQMGFSIVLSAALAFVFAAAVNYFLCTAILFRHRARWNALGEVIAYAVIVAVVGIFDVVLTRQLATAGFSPAAAKAIAIAFGFVANFAGRRYVVFSEPTVGPWGEAPGRLDD